MTTSTRRRARFHQLEVAEVRPLTADSVEVTMRQAGARPAHVEGYDRADWILMDFFTLIVHVFAPHTRDFYALERLWGDAERIEMTDEPPDERE